METFRCSYVKMISIVILMVLHADPWRFLLFCKEWEKILVACSSVSHNPPYIQKAATDSRTKAETEISCSTRQHSKQIFIFIPESWKQEGLLKTCMWFRATVAGNHAQILKKMSCYAWTL